MQLFSRNKALAALSLGALAALGACGDDVTVPVAPAAPVVISITPPSASMNIGESLNFAVQISGGSTTAAPTLASCTSSNAAVATAAVTGSACRVTAVAAGNATVTAAASTGQVAAASISVSAPAPAITGLSVSPSAAQIAVGGSVTIVPTVNRANASVNVAYTYTSSTASVATVSAAGVVTAVAPGTATITVAAAGTGTGFSAANLAAAATITVSERAPGLTSLQVSPASSTMIPGGTQQVTAAAQGPRASAATITYSTTTPSVATVSASGLITGVAPGTATITVTAQSTQDGAFAASSLTGLVAVTVNANAQVSITQISQGGFFGGGGLGTLLPVDVTNAFGQLDINLALATNGRVVQSVQAFVCAAPATACPAAGQAPAAQQTFGASGAASGNITLSLNSANFTVNADWTQATVSHTNGLKVIAVSITTADGASIRATGNLAELNFNNGDAVAVRHVAPTRSATAANGLQYFGGPGAEGRGSATVVPVMFTSGRQLRTAQLSINGCTSSYTFNSVDDALPWTVSYGATQTLDANGNVTALGLGCAYATPSGAAVDVVPAVLNALDMNGVNISTTIVTSPTVRAPATIAVDYQAPTITTLNVAGGGSAGNPDAGWVNGSYAFDRRDANGTRIGYVASDNNGVGLRAARDTRFAVCNTPEVITNLTAPVDCTSPVATGGLSATVASMGLGENATNLTNTAYYVQASESDRLGNTVTSVPFTWQDNSGAAPVGQTATSDFAMFGVDVTAPVLLAIPNPAATEPTDQPSLAGFARSSIDSIFSQSLSTHFSNTTAIPSDGAINAANALFAVRVRDARSGFATCVAGGCLTTANRTAIGTFQIERRRSNIPVGTSAPSNTAIVENIVAVPSATAPQPTNVMDAASLAGDASVRQFSVNIFGAGDRYPATLPAAFAPAASVSGYYTFTGTIRDRAGNTATVPTRRVVIDNGTPTATSVAFATLTGGSPATFTINGSDDLEITGAELSLAYPGGINLRYPRVANFAATSRTGLFGSPFASLTSGLLGAVIGTGASSSTFSGNVTMPAPLIQDLQILESSGAAPASGAAGTPAKPTAVTGTIFDIKSMVNTTGPSTSVSAWAGTSATATATIPGYAVSGSTIVKQWGPSIDVSGTTIPGAGVSAWFVYTASTTAAEFRSQCSSSNCSVPFTSARVVTRRFDTSNGTYEASYIDRGTATYAGTVDDGGSRFHRWTWTAGSAVSQGNQTSIAAFADGDSLRAIGLDAQGNGLMTAASASGTTTFGRTITALSVLAVNIFPESATPSSDYNTQGGWYNRSTSSSSQTLSAVDISTDARVYIGKGTTNATARIWLTVTPATGVTLDATNTTITATSNSTDIAVVGSCGRAARFGGTTQTFFCDVRGNPALLANGFATLTITAARAASGPYSAATAANTFTTYSLYTGAPSLNLAAGFQPIATAGPQPVRGPSSSAAGAPGFVMVSAPTLSAFFAGTVTFEYRAFFTTTTTGLSIGTPVVNPFTGEAQIPVSCTSTGSTTVDIPIQILVRGVTNIGYSTPYQLNALPAGTFRCQNPA